MKSMATFNSLRLGNIRRQLKQLRKSNITMKDFADVKGSEEFPTEFPSHLKKRVILHKGKPIKRLLTPDEYLNKEFDLTIH